jgi:hypothetical protein
MTSAFSDEGTTSPKKNWRKKRDFPQTKRLVEATVNLAELTQIPGCQRGSQTRRHRRSTARQTSATTDKESATTSTS